MKLLLLCTVISLVSCTSYQYLKVDAPGMSRNKENGFVTEKDSLQVSYQFYGADGPLQIEVYNKTGRGMVLDLNRSALVVNNQAASFYKGDIQIKGISRGASVEWQRRVTGNFTRFSASATQQPDMLFVPSQSYISFTPMNLTDSYLDTLPAAGFTKKKVTTDDGIVIPVNTISFQPSTSPLVFSTHLTFISSDTERKEFIQQHHFYVSEIVEASKAPGILPYSFSPNGDKFYVSKVRPTDSTGSVYRNARVD